jgi:dihydrofolate reductase
MTKTRNLIVYIAMSLDGYITGPNQSLDFLKMVEKEGEDYGYATFLQTTDTIIIGRKSYDKVLSIGIAYPHADKTVYIMTRTAKPAIDTLNYYSGNLKALVLELKNKPGKNIFCDGGAEIVNQLLKDDLIDEFIISVIPVLLGNGIRLFNNSFDKLSVSLIGISKFETGLIQLHYVRINR